MIAYRKLSGVNRIEEVNVDRMTDQWVFYTVDGMTEREPLQGYGVTWYRTREQAVATERRNLVEDVRRAQSELETACANLAEFEELEGEEADSGE